MRSIAETEKISGATVAAEIKRELASLPQNELITKQYCTRFGGVLNVDGIYVKVKGLPKAVPFIYAIDFETHDPVAGILALAENDAAFERLFLILKDIGYPLRLVVADEAPALQAALERIFPGIEVQLCHVHVLRNVRKMLHLSSRDETHLPFFRAVQKLLAMPREANRELYLREMRSWERIELYGTVLKTITGRWNDLFRFEAMQRRGIRCPKTNNLIEGYNNHMKTRIRGIKGFESLSSASRWLNAWLLRRRFTPFRECGKPFEHLNGHSSFEQSRNKNLPWPDIYYEILPEIPTQN